MDTLAALVESGRIVDIMLLFVAVEVIALAGFRLITGRGIPLPALILNIGAGGSLMVGLKLVFDQAPWQWVAVALVAALVFHVGDLLQRRGSAERP
jgi:hypothetical protein